MSHENEHSISFSMSQSHNTMTLFCRPDKPYEYTRTNPTSGSIFEDRQILKIEKVTTNVSLSTRTSPATESTNAAESWEILRVSICWNSQTT
jgi:hypothetical protein